ncbi:MAG: hypothetical protein OEV50_05735, partial [Candidatus Aminicenantes bacterium]|nr:hypothetical protein [Candidatus Aminicenantes bacterium]
WRSLGINSAFVSVSLYSQKDFKELAGQNGISTFLIVPIFYNPEELQKKPDLYAVTDKGEEAREEWVSFVCPSRGDYRKQRVEYIKNLVKELNPDGISLDFIRYFVFWEKIYPDRTLDSITNTCFDQHCLDNFQKDTGVRLPPGISLSQEKAKWIIENHKQEWTEWKCKVITSMVETIAAETRRIKPELKINVHAVPWREGDFGGAVKIIAGQDLKAIAAFTDFISPMCYSHMVQREPPWINSVVKDIQTRTKSRTIPSIQVKEAYLSETLSLQEFREALSEALKPPSSGVVFWSWEALEQDPEKKDIIKTLLVSQ